MHREPRTFPNGAMNLLTISQNKVTGARKSGWRQAASYTDTPRKLQSQKQEQDGTQKTLHAIKLRKRKRNATELAKLKLQLERLEFVHLLLCAIWLKQRTLNWRLRM